MADGFIFKPNMCVGCRACIAACTLENGWTFRARNIYTFNSEAIPGFPLVNISLACNHCEKAPCMDGCPSAAYFRDTATGAVIIDDRRCIGCRYCEWNCPYGAPEFIVSEQVAGKCNFCAPLQAEKLPPACTTACPTGALSFGALNPRRSTRPFSWFPDKQLRPALELRGKEEPPLRISPQQLFDTTAEINADAENDIRGEWSLVAFSFLAVMSVATILSALISGTFPGTLRVFTLTFLAGLLSVFHLGKKARAWRAVANIKNSPVSREIALFIAYSLLAAAAVIFRLPFLLLISSVAGIALALAVDSVYIFADKRREVFLHSGQAFITLLQVVSFSTGKILPFIFIAGLRLAASVYGISAHRRNDSPLFGIRFMRFALLFISGVSLASGISYPGYPVMTLFLAGELIDRILFYTDFNPLNINKTVNIKNIGLRS